MGLVNAINSHETRLDCGAAAGAAGARRDDTLLDGRVSAGRPQPLAVGLSVTNHYEKTMTCGRAEGIGARSGRFGRGADLGAAP